MEFICAAAGGFFGAGGRYLASALPLWKNAAFPWGTLLINLAGAALIGFLAGIGERRPDISPGWITFWKTGVCGGFTTFSTFSLETLTLLEKGRLPLALAYAAGSVALCVLGVWAGRQLARAL